MWKWKSSNVAGLDLYRATEQYKLKVKPYQSFSLAHLTATLMVFLPTCTIIKVAGAESIRSSSSAAKPFIKTSNTPSWWMRAYSDYLCKSIKPQSNWLDTSLRLQDLVFLEAVKVSTFVPAFRQNHLVLLKEIQLTWVESIEEGLDLCFQDSLFVKGQTVWL